MSQDGGGPPRGLAVIEPRRQRQSRQIFCFNCARKGHFGHVSIFHFIRMSDKVIFTNFDKYFDFSMHYSQLHSTTKAFSTVINCFGGQKVDNSAYGTDSSPAENHIKSYIHNISCCVLSY